MNDGQRDGKGGRWCAAHGRSHGSLHVCPEYSAEARARIETEGVEFRNNLRDPAWCDEQRAKGIPEIALDMMRVFAGVTPRSGEPT